MKIRPKILIVCPQEYWHKWDGETAISEHGIGGAELVAIKMAEYLSKQNWDVYFTCNCEKIKIWNDVTYFPLNKYNDFLKYNIIHTLIAYRFANSISYYNVERVILSVEDYKFFGQLPIVPDKFKYILCKSEWHKDILGGISHQLFPYLKILGNGIDIDRFDKQICNKTKNRFIYTTDPCRGLKNLLRMFPKIRNILPDATLHVFCDIEFTNYGKKKDLVKNIYETLQKTEGAVIYPWVSQDRLALEIKKSEYWVYPSDITETYSITALEMQLGRVHCIYRKFSGLTTTIGDRGYGIDADPANEEVDNLYLQAIEKINKREFNKLDIAEEWARTQTWNSIGERLNELIEF